MVAMTVDIFISVLHIAYVSTLVQDRPEKIYSYRCVSKATFGALVRKNKTVKDASKMCPKDPFAEPLVKGGVQVDGSGKKRQSSVLPTKSASQVASKTVKPGIVITAPTAQQAPSNGNLRTVDRSASINAQQHFQFFSVPDLFVFLAAATQPMGANQRPLPPRKRVVKEDDYACEKFVSLSVSTPEAFVECQNTAIEGYSYPTEAEKACISNVYSTCTAFCSHQSVSGSNWFIFRGYLPLSSVWCCLQRVLRHLRQPHDPVLQGHHLHRLVAVGRLCQELSHDRQRQDSILRCQE